jgi:hypothetical protein
VTVDLLTDNEAAIRAFARAGFVAEREERDGETGKALPDHGETPIRIELTSARVAPASILICRYQLKAASVARERRTPPAMIARRPLRSPR